MKKFIGYLLAVIGLIGLAVNSKIGRKFFPFVESLNKNYLLVGSLILIITGILIASIFRSKVRQSEKEVPIYRGKKIVGYRVEN